MPTCSSGCSSYILVFIAVPIFCQDDKQYLVNRQWKLSFDSHVDSPPFMPFYIFFPLISLA